jgi:tRNA(fMet)-specific endonuclease VapC
MIRLLDTNTCIYFLNRSSDKIIAQFKKLSPSEIKLSAITVAELFFGAEKSQAKRKNWQVVESFISVFETVPFDEKCSKIYAKIRASLEKAGNPIGPMDLLIASISLANDFILVTNNTKEFDRIKKLKFENWLQMH